MDLNYEQSYVFAVSLQILSSTHFIAIEVWSAMDGREHEKSNTDHRRVPFQSDETLPTRRTLLAGLGATGGSTVLLAGCLGEDESDTNSGTDETDGGSTIESDGHEDEGGDETAREDGDADEDGESAEDSDDEESDDEETGTAEDADGDLDVEFVSCTRGEVAGTFDADDLIYASTGFYDEGLYGNTLLEDGITFGEDVETPFSGTVVLEIGDEATVEESADEIVVEIPAYGSDGTVLTGLTTDPDDYAGAGISHENPIADSCLDDVGTGASDGPFEIAALETNAPIDGGEYLEATAGVRNAGETEATGEIWLVVGHDAEVVESRTLTIGAGETETVRVGYETPQVETDQEFPIAVESEGDEIRENVVVYGSA